MSANLTDYSVRCHSESRRVVVCMYLDAYVRDWTHGQDVSPFWRAYCMEMLLRSMIAWLFTGIYWITLIFVHILMLRKTPDKWITGAIHIWGRSVLRILSVELELMNESTISERSARVVIVNHQSALDLIWGAAVSPPAILVIGKKEVMYIPVLNLIWWGLKMIRVDRRNHIRALAALSGVAVKIRDDQRSLVIAPEGTRTADGKIGHFKKGAFRIAAEANVPICPVVVSGAYEILPKRNFFPKKGKIRVFFMPPVNPDGIRNPDGSISEAFIGEVREAMIEQEGKMRSRE